MKSLKYTWILLGLGIAFFFILGITDQRETPETTYVTWIFLLLGLAVGYGYHRFIISRYAEHHRLAGLLLFLICIGIPIGLAYSGVPVLQQAAGGFWWWLLASVGFSTWRFIRMRRHMGKGQEDAENIESYSKGFVLAAAILGAFALPVLLLALFMEGC